MPDEQGNEVWKDWWDKHQAEQSAAIRTVNNRRIEEALGVNSQPDTSPDAQEILVVGSILSRDGE